uniref:DUF676 domain-containing protein n=1 Tax=Haptolina brevifila TaxID=156173 RepID=A0A7S2GTW5_9EUKA|mmetsp:Transcript_46297/g.92415  ORF Transcript_46297/g.92415 Transcript_46297/m.92415 type:complete len:408 (+) Transcript_46297:26-1249(+)
MTTPAALGPVCTYFERADELKKAYPFAANQLRLFGVELAMKMKKPDAGRFLMAQMDVLEAEKMQPSFTTPPSVQQAVPVAPPPEVPVPLEAPQASATAEEAEADAGSEGVGKASDDAVTSAMGEATLNEAPAPAPQHAPPPPPPPPPAVDSLVRDPVLICPAQFGTAGDYDELAEELRALGHPVMVAPLTPFEWFRLIPATLTAEYWRGDLSPDVALPFYYEAIAKGAEELTKAYPGRKISLVAHSIGGWITRSYLGQLSDDDRSKFGALVTLGTPHAPPPEGFFRTLDQTRGLLRFVEERYPGAYHPELRYMSVGSDAVAGSLPWSSNGRLLESTLALASYLPLCGDAFIRGDGITPLACAHLEGAEQRTLEAFHIAFVPLLGTRLRGTPWYGSPGIVEKWADFLQ